MPKLLACCEYNVARSTVDTLHSELREMCASEPLLARSWARIAEGFAIAIHQVKGVDIISKCNVEPCNCKCCQHRRVYDQGACKCTTNMVSGDTAKKLVPTGSPKEFLAMAAAAEKPK